MRPVRTGPDPPGGERQPAVIGCPSAARLRDRHAREPHRQLPRGRRDVHRCRSAGDDRGPVRARGDRGDSRCAGHAGRAGRGPLIRAARAPPGPPDMVLDGTGMDRTPPTPDIKSWVSAVPSANEPAQPRHPLRNHPDGRDRICRKTAAGKPSHPRRRTARHARSG